MNLMMSRGNYFPEEQRTRAEMLGVQRESMLHLRE